MILSDKEYILYLIFLVIVLRGRKMKIEKINDSQMKFILNHSDLEDRGIRFVELEYGSDKTRELFKEMIEQANIEYDFEPDDSPLMVEAIPITSDSIMVIVTKMSCLEDLDIKLNLFASAGIHNLQFNRDDTHSHNQYQRSETTISHKARPRSSNIAIYVFNTLDEIINISKQADSIYNGRSSVFKHDEKYFLVLEGRLLEKTISLFNEYAQKYSTNLKSKYHLIEHGEIITKDKALEKYSTIEL